jgi:hypothetical protein
MLRVVAVEDRVRKEAACACEPLVVPLVDLSLQVGQPERQRVPTVQGHQHVGDVGLLHRLVERDHHALRARLPEVDAQLPGSGEDLPRRGAVQVNPNRVEVVGVRHRVPQPRRPGCQE